MQDWRLWVLVSYLCGSVPFGLLIGLAWGVDIRKSGSGNVGATNASRVLGRNWGITCFLLDVSKGAAPVLGAGWAMGLLGGDLSAGQAWQWLAVAATAILGHIYPIWLRFRGGKGVATGLGVLLGLWPVLTLAAVMSLVIWVVTVSVSRYVSVASMAAAVSIPTVLVITTVFCPRHGYDAQPFLIATTGLAALVVARHRSNIARLRAGTEPKIGKRG